MGMFDWRKKLVPALPGLMACACALLSLGSAVAVAQSPEAPQSASQAAPQAAPATPANTSMTEPADEPLAEVTVEAPEPRYAAPTVRDRIGRVWAPVLINGKGPYRLVLDTGASRSALIQSVINSLGITASAKGVRVTGVTGTAIVPLAPLQRMEVGDLLMGPSTLPIVADVFGGAEGVLGTEGLADKRIMIDFAHDWLDIRYSRGALPRGLSNLPLRRLNKHLLALDVTVGGVKATAIVDTGSQITIGNTALRDALSRRRISGAIPRLVQGVTLDQEPGDLIMSPPIDAGVVQFIDAAITYGDMHIFERWQLTREPALVLGMDILGSVDELIIDYRLLQMQVRLRKQP
jgi:predicted aspartyl protease